jgi:hypothetical protein
MKTIKRFLYIFLLLFTGALINIFIDTRRIWFGDSKDQRLSYVKFAKNVFNRFYLPSRKLNMNGPMHTSTITCPYCGHAETETMPTETCQIFYECKSCRLILKPRKGDCCVYCSYGSVKCPPIQQQN